MSTSVSGPRAPARGVSSGLRALAQGRNGAWWGVPAAALLLLAAALSGVAGGYGLPQNDDWAFSRVTLTLHREGAFSLIGAGRMTLIGHALWGQPFLALLGENVATLHTAGLVAAVLCVLAAAGLGWRLTWSPAGAALAALSVVALPGFLQLSAGWMTDVTAYAGQVSALALAAAALASRGNRRTFLLALAAAVAVGAFSSRQTAIPALLAIGVAVLVDGLRAGARRRLALETGLVAVACAAGLAIYVWRAGLPNQDPIPAGTPSFFNLLQILSCALTLGLATSPALVVWFVRARPPSRWLLGTLVVVWMAGRLVLPIGLVGNTFTAYGSPFGVIAGQKGRIVPQPVWQLLELVAVLGAAGLCFAAITTLLALRNRRLITEATPLDALLVVFTVLSLGAALAPAAGGGNLFDRYLWPAATGLTLLLLRAAALGGRSRGARTRAESLVPAGLIVMLLAVSFLLVVEGSSFARARWDAGLAAVAIGVPADRVDAGYEWTGWHAELPLPATGRAPDVGTSLSWWSAAYAPVVPCVVISATPLEDPRYRLTSERRYTVLPGWQEMLYVQSRSGEGCPA